MLIKVVSFFVAIVNLHLSIFSGFRFAIQIIDFFHGAPFLLVLTQPGSTKVLLSCFRFCSLLSLNSQSTLSYAELLISVLNFSFFIEPITLISALLTDSIAL